MPLTVISRKGTPNLYLRGTVRGEYVYETAGTDDPAIAEEIRIRREAELLEASVHGKRVAATFMQAATAYLENGGSPRFLGTQDPETGQWDGLIGRFGRQRLSAIKQDDLDLAARQMFPDASPDTRNRQVYTPFIAVWNDAATRDWCDPKAWRRPRKAKGTRVRAVKRAGSFPVPYERAAEFTLAMPPLDAMSMTVLFYTGMRPIEWFNVTDQDVNLEGRWITLPASKTGEPRGVPIPEAIVSILEALTSRFGGLLANYWNKRARVIEPYPETKDAGGQLGGAIKHARSKTGILDVSPYTARHSVSTYLVAAGVHPHIKDQILGHAVTDMSRRYTHLPQPELIDAINKLPRPDVWMGSDLVQNPCTILRNVIEWSQYQGDRRKFPRPW